VSSPALSLIKLAITVSAVTLKASLSFFISGFDLTNRNYKITYDWLTKTNKYLVHDCAGHNRAVKLVNWQVHFKVNLSIEIRIATSFSNLDRLVFNTKLTWRKHTFDVDIDKCFLNREETT
jgi:hypothetical protein